MSTEETKMTTEAKIPSVKNSNFFVARTEESV
jgi:hypothetical protein